MRAGGLKPVFPFGHGLSYTRYRYANLKVEGGKTVSVSFDVTNVGTRAGKDVPQVYIRDRAGKAGTRLIGWGNVALAPGKTQRLTVAADPRILADWSSTRRAWIVSPGIYKIAVGPSSDTITLSGSAILTGGALQ